MTLSELLINIRRTMPHVAIMGERDKGAYFELTAPNGVQLVGGMTQTSLTEYSVTVGGLTGPAVLNLLESLNKRLDT